MDIRPNAWTFTSWSLEVIEKESPGWDAAIVPSFDAKMLNEFPFEDLCFE